MAKFRFFYMKRSLVMMGFILIKWLNTMFCFIISSTSKLKIMSIYMHFSVVVQNCILCLYIVAHSLLNKSFDYVMKYLISTTKYYQYNFL